MGINFSEILIEIDTFSFKQKALENVVKKIADILSRPQCVKKDTEIGICMDSQLFISVN